MQESTQYDSLTSSDSLERVFFELFSNRFDSSISTYGTGKWRSVSRLHYLSDIELSQATSGTANFLRAVQPDVCNSFTVLQIDSDRPHMLTQVVKTLRSCGIEHFQIIKNSEPENMQVYVFWDRKVPMVQAADLFTALFEKQLLSPHVAVITQNLVLPLQRGFVWLNEDCSIKQSREKLSRAQAEEIFLGDLINRPSNFDYAETAISSILNARTSDFVTATATSDNGARPNDRRIVAFELGVDAELTNVSNQNLEKAALNEIQLAEAESLNQKPKCFWGLHPGASVEILFSRKTFDRRLFKEANIASVWKLINQPPLDVAAPNSKPVDSFIAGELYFDQRKTTPNMMKTKAATRKGGGSVRASPKIDSHRQLTLSLTSHAAREKKLSSKSV